MERRHQGLDQPGYHSATAQNSIVQRATTLTSSSAGHPLVLLHGGKASHETESAVPSFRGDTVRALQRVIDWYRSRGYRFVAMDGTSGLGPIRGFSGHGSMDVIARTPGGGLYLYKGNGIGGWGSGRIQIGPAGRPLRRSSGCAT